MSSPPLVHGRAHDLSSSQVEDSAEQNSTNNSSHLKRFRRRTALLIALTLVALLSIIVSLGLGPVPIPPQDVVQILWDFAFGSTSDLGNSAVVTELRLPRISLAFLAGVGLAIAGAALQSYFRNPLADPGVTGIANGAAVGAVIVIVTGISALGAWLMPIAAFIGALVVLVIIQIVAATTGGNGVATLLLVGIAINAFTGALMSAIIANAQDSQTVRGAMFWLQGDLSVASWDDVFLALAPVMVGVLILGLMSRDLNGLLLGDDTASSIGMDVTRIRLQVLAATSLIIGGSVAVTGVIGFVGLVAPHVVRLLIGSDHRCLIPASGLLGGAFLVMADTVARVAPAHVSWQTGVVTGLVGAPFFLALVLHSRRHTGRL
ncbi:FecCD family ABC transporter permease [Corynebacterium casei]|uniref:FecCD family ABC transporter permease n=1 Tax=Corynebacterium casei TaxID=160386 RepID=UPI003FCF8DC9